LTLVSCCSMVPQCHPVVEPERHTDAPTRACTEPVTSTTSPSCALTPGVAVHWSLVATQAMSLPGKVDASKVPCAVRSNPVVVSPGSPQCPAVTKPGCSTAVTENPTEQRAESSM